jgi:hypothetical protein
MSLLQPVSRKVSASTAATGILSAILPTALAYWSGATTAQDAVTAIVSAVVIGGANFVVGYRTHDEAISARVTRAVVTLLAAAQRPVTALGGRSAVTEVEAVGTAVEAQLPPATAEAINATLATDAEPVAEAITDPASPLARAYTLADIVRIFDIPADLAADVAKGDSQA